MSDKGLLMSAGKPRSILCIGAVMVDLVCHVPRLPLSGEGIVVSGREMRLGGCAFNSASMASRLGASCFLMAPLGKGPFSSFALEELSAQGLGAYQAETDMDCGMCFCMVEPDGERTMVTTPGIERFIEDDWFATLNANDYSIALAAGYEIEGPGGDAIIGFLEKNPMIEFVYAPGPRILGVEKRKMDRIVTLSPIWHLNDQEAIRYATERLGVSFDGSRKDQALDAGSAIAQAYGGVSVVTMGPDGSAALFPDGFRLVVPTTPIDPIDTVGAGDAHLGAFAAARNAGLDWRASLDIANRAAAAVCMVSGSFLSKEQCDLAGLCL